MFLKIKKRVVSFIAIQSYLVWNLVLKIVIYLICYCFLFFNVEEWYLHTLFLLSGSSTTPHFCWYFDKKSTPSISQDVTYWPVKGQERVGDKEEYRSRYNNTWSIKNDEKVYFSLKFRDTPIHEIMLKTVLCICFFLPN